MNARKLKSVMMLHGDSGRSLSDYLGISEATFSTKINRYRGAEFTQREIQAIKDKYSLTPEEIDSIFFDIEVSK
jgi:hypothetical protein